MDHSEPIEFGLVGRQDCPCCGAAESFPILDLPYDTPPVSSYLRAFYGAALDITPLRGARYELRACPACGLVFQTHAPNDPYLRHLYGAAALAEPAEVSADRGLAVRQAYATDIEQAIRFLGGEPHRMRVLDHGAGTGLWLQMAAAYGCSTAGTEFSRQALDRLERAGHDAFEPDWLPADSFDFINSEQVLEHLVEPATAVAQLVRAMRPGGLLRICVPNGANIRVLLDVGDWGAPKGTPHSLNAVAPLEHLNCFDPGSLCRLATGAGLEPFRFPLRQSLQPSSRIRTAAGALRARLHPRPGTLQWFRRPG